MALRTGHGNGKGQPRIEVMPADELPFPVAAPPAADSVPLSFRQDGKIGDTATAKELGRRGGQAKARRLRLVDSLGLAAVSDDASFAPYRNAADEFVKAHLAELATMTGGTVGSGPSSMIASAAMQLAASRWAFDRGATGDDAALMKLGSTLANESRQNLMAGYEMAIREAKVRPKTPDEGTFYGTKIVPEPTE